MKPYQQQFIQLALEHDVLCFGEFTLKSGRQSPFFFNAGKFSSGSALAQLGRCYADAIVDSGIEFDVLFGPAYKGIPLVATIAVALAEHHDIDTPYCFNRKEKKQHGEGGQLVGADIAQQKVLIVDDVMTAGTAIREAIGIIEQAQAQVAGVMIGMDRQERGQSTLSAVQEIAKNHQIPVASVVTLDKIVDYIRQDSHQQATVLAIEAYKQQYGCLA